ncbi:phospholipase A2 inhibitor gamma subunit B-like isoform X2 [Lissotriton helveticus]
MRNPCVIALILASLLTNGNAILCVRCISTEEQSCSREPEACPSGYNVCLTKIVQLTIDDASTAIEFIRGCGNYRDDCNKIESVSAVNIKISSNSTCCSQDRCEPQKPKVPVLKFFPNGAQCRTCFSVTSTECKPRGSLSCSGIRNRCVTLGLQFRGGRFAKIAIRGCGSKDVCEDRSSEIAYSPHISVFKKVCSDSTTIRPEHSLFLTAAISLWVKLF